MTRSLCKAQSNITLGRVFESQPSLPNYLMTSLLITWHINFVWCMSTAIRSP